MCRNFFVFFSRQLFIFFCFVFGVKKNFVKTQQQLGIMRENKNEEFFFKKEKIRSLAKKK